MGHMGIFSYGRSTMAQDIPASLRFELAHPDFSPSHHFLLYSLIPVAQFLLLNPLCRYLNPGLCIITWSLLHVLLPDFYPPVLTKSLPSASLLNPHPLISLPDFHLPHSRLITPVLLPDPCNHCYLIDSLVSFLMPSPPCRYLNPVSLFDHDPHVATWSPLVVPLLDPIPLHCYLIPVSCVAIWCPSLMLLNPCAPCGYLISVPSIALWFLLLLDLWPPGCWWIPCLALPPDPPPPCSDPLMFPRSLFPWNSSLHRY